ncbi:MAG: type I pantothenate kinase [Caulobacteraceae bacterium]|nr:type I pantothenate kinase [Caulobacteraceae bacterium]
MAGAADLAHWLLDLRPSRGVLVVGLTGAVAAGKSTLAASLVELIPKITGGEVTVTSVSTDGFLRPNADLDSAGLTLRKGFPETYDRAAMEAALRQVRLGTTVFPGYSHLTYDRDPALAREIRDADILIVEGLGFTASTPVDVGVYLDAEEADLETWYVRRFRGLCQDGRDDPSSFYHRFARLDEAGVDSFARSVWAGINLPNLRENIAPLRETSGIVVRKGSNHEILTINSPRPRKRGGPRPADEPMLQARGFSA